MRSYGPGIADLRAKHFVSVWGGGASLEPCSACGTGEMKIVNVNIEGWCDGCNKHFSRCKCANEAGPVEKRNDSW